MQNFLFADAISATLRNELLDYDIYKEENPEAVADTNRWLLPHALLMEVSSHTPWTPEERLKTREEVKRRNPDCKIVFVVDENAMKQTAEEVRRAKKEGLIDQFIYGSISASYLVAIMDTL
jgi:DNA-binding NarL/FixJ family response regulator